jgi:hypothetical protein
MLRIRKQHGPVYAQLVLACAAIFIVSFVPPAHGAILILSLKGERPGEIVRWAITHDARLVGPGPWPHSLVVEGSRATLVEASFGQAGLLMAGGATGCSEKGR